MGFSPYAGAKKKAEASGTTIEQIIAETNAARQTIVMDKRITANQSRGKSIYTNKNNNNQKGSPANTANYKPKETPKAPYNFVPLNDVVVTAPLADNVNAEEEQQAYKKFLTSTEKKYSGYFEVEVENITPLFINNGKDSFFKDGKNYLIPGSSLRGAIKNYFKIITNGTMRTGDDGDVMDKYLDKKSIGEHIPANINADKLDFTTAMFGNKDNWSSRVFFENLYLKDDKKASFENASEAIPLLGANPTSFQNYLEPKSDRAAFWNEDTNIRGYKLYWHKKCDWRRKQNEKKQNKKITKTIAPLKEGHTFIGRVRFENLSAVELGALAKVLSLGDDGKSAYKLGMGKPIGMGSVHLKAELYLQNDAYYTSLFTSSGFDNGLVLEDKQYYINIFQKYMSAKLPGKSMQLYEERMKDLASIMNENHLGEAGWAEKTAYMSINSPADKDLANKRIPLPSIEEVLKQ